MASGNGKKIRARKKAFSWNTRQELSEYFRRHYQVDAATVNNEIYRALDAFKLRKGLPIDARELWQKAGNAMRKRVKRADAGC